MTGPAPAVAAQRAAVLASLAGLPRDSLVLVACSGGPDSLALAAATAFVAPRHGWRAGAVVVDHGLQPGSAAVAERAGGQCRSLGLDPVEVVPARVRGGGGPEAAARAARYAALTDAAARHGAVAVLLGHTLDDQAETVLLGLARGSGARSLAGMGSVRGPFRRPLLQVRRTETVAACAAQGLDAWDDPTNGPAGTLPDGDGLPLRSRVRHQVMPVLEEVLGPGVATALARTAEQLHEDAEVLEEMAVAVLADARVRDPAAGDRVVLDTEALRRAPAAVRRRALHRAMVEAGVAPGSLGRAHVLAVDGLVVDWRGQGPVALPAARTARRRCGRLTVGTAGAGEGER